MIRKLFWMILAMLLVAGCGTPVPPTVSATGVPPHTPTPFASLWSTATAIAPFQPTATLTATAIASVEPSSTPTTIAPSPTLSPLATATPTPLTPTATATPLSTHTPSPTPSPRVAVWEGTVTLMSYGWKAALVTTAADDPIYPYPRLNRDLVVPPAPRTYKTVVLENDYVRLTVLPELGGRLYRWLDKTDGRELFYVNPVLKPTHWGARGWWLATGGMEWAFPVEEHGLIESRPWRYQVASDRYAASIALSDQDDRTGLAVEVVVVLEAGHSYLTIRPRIHNPTETEHPYQFWLNGMFALSPANRPSPDLRFTLPGNTVTIHSTGDRGLPDAGEEMSWPIYDSRDMSRYGNWKRWLGIFCRDAEYMGAYDPTSEMGVVRVFPSAIAKGAKIFGPAGIAPATWTDDESGYVELWGGLTPTFWDYASLPPGRSISWEERWYSLSGLGGLSYANDDAALWLAPSAGQVQVGALTTAPMTGRLVLWRDGQVVATWTVKTAPGSPFGSSQPAGNGGNWGLHLLDTDGQPVAAYGTVGP